MLFTCTAVLLLWLLFILQIISPVLCTDCIIFLLLQKYSVLHLAPGVLVLVLPSIHAAYLSFSMGKFSSYFYFLITFSCFIAFLFLHILLSLFSLLLSAYSISFSYSFPSHFSLFPPPFSFSFLAMNSSHTLINLCLSPCFRLACKRVAENYTLKAFKMCLVYKIWSTLEYSESVSANVLVRQRELSNQGQCRSGLVCTLDYSKPCT